MWCMTLIHAAAAGAGADASAVTNAAATIAKKTPKKKTHFKTPTTNCSNTKDIKNIYKIS